MTNLYLDRLKAKRKELLSREGGFEGFDGDPLSVRSTIYRSLKTCARHRKAANAILDHIHNGDLQGGFTFQDAHCPQWPNLTNRKWVRGGLDLLCGLGWLKTFKKPTVRGQRPIAYYVCLEVRDLPKRRLGCEISICLTHT